MEIYSSVTILNLCDGGLFELPDLSIYPNLKKLDCHWNKLTRLDNLPSGLQVLHCSFNPFDYDFEPTLENIRKHNLEHCK